MIPICSSGNEIKCFNDNIRIVDDIIPEGVTSIGEKCFNECFLLTKVSLPSSLKEIGIKAFYETNIKDVIIPEGITKYECQVPLIIQSILNKKEIECPNVIRKRNQRK